MSNTFAHANLVRLFQTSVISTSLPFLRALVYLSLCSLEELHVLLKYEGQQTSSTAFLIKTKEKDTTVELFYLCYGLMN